MAESSSTSFGPWSAERKPPSMSLLDSFSGPDDLKLLRGDQLPALAADIREFLVERVSRTGGHLGPNLGVVELTIALHSEFDSPRDVILWDTGHQAYVHKILTGRAAGFESLRSRGGLSGYPSRAESPHDVIENSHASTALSYADGIAKVWELRGELAVGRQAGRHVVAVVGDGSLTGGMAWEALNNIACSDRQVVVVVNDNARSYAPTIGGLAEHLASLRTNAGYERVLDWGRRWLRRAPLVGDAAYGTMHGLKKGIKDIVSPQGLFEDLGLKYLGPIDGHDIGALRHALRLARRYAGPVVVHVLTEKGHGYAPAEADDAEKFHGIGTIDPVTGEAVQQSGTSWTSVFGEEITNLAESDPSIVAITAAMLGPVGLASFAERFPERVFDVGIAEQHAVASAAGMAFAGAHPVVALYSTFLNRAFDQLVMDAALHRAPMTIVLDRSGVTGEDGSSHHGAWDLAIAAIVPGIRVAAPRDADELRARLREAVAIKDGPTIVRYPRGPVSLRIDAVESIGCCDVLRRGSKPDVLLVAVGAMAELCMDAAVSLEAAGRSVTVIDPRWVLPVSPHLVEKASRHAVVITVEDGIRSGGVGSRLSQAMRDAGHDSMCRDVGLPAAFVGQGTRGELLAEARLTAVGVAGRVGEWWP